VKIYNHTGGRAESKRFFRESLADYVSKSGLSVPAQALDGEANIIRGPHGKPYFEDPALKGIFFSRSHSSNYEVLCFSDGEVGLDCENTKGRPGICGRFAGIAERCFTEDEREYVMGTGSESGSKDEDDPLTRFFEVWTAKEAYMKYTGNGFSEGFRTFSVLRVPDVSIETGRLEDAPGVVYSVCTARAGGSGV